MSTNPSDHLPAPEGWKLQELSEHFGTQAGPFYFRHGAEPGVGFFSSVRHANIQKFVHGGMLMTLADMSLWDVARRRIGRFNGVTLTLNAEFLAPGPMGVFIEATGEVLRAGKSIVFVRGIVRAGDDALLSYSGSLKLFATPPAPA
ncbi:MAG: PaaI family thioesterase [Parvularculaceae bacterium]|nr:PaaI family thioesterase [Parvularculaceae bacterium]